MNASEAREPAGLPVNMIRPHMRDIPQVPFPEGFGIRTMRGDPPSADMSLWTDIQRDSEEFVEIADDLFMKEFGDDLPATQRRCFFMVEELTSEREGGRAVGTISAWYSREFRGQDYGRIHWVAVRPAYRRRGLAKAGLSWAMNRLAERHERSWLSTQTRRVPAIRLYLDFGFRPDLEPDGALSAWREVRARLRHPGLAGLE